MDIGTGKDLNEYIKADKNIRFHLIDICEASEKYNVARFQNDFAEVFQLIKSRKALPILCGGTGLYIQAVLSDLWKMQVPVNDLLRAELECLSSVIIFERFGDLLKDYSFLSKKKLIRAVEINEYLKDNPDFETVAFKPISYRIFGLHPEVGNRRARISKRLKDRFENQGLLTEIEELVASGVSFEILEYYGLEYKYISYFLKKEMSFEEMFTKLETEIHRFAKRQMTFFRSMERKGFEINWIPDQLNEEEKVSFILDKI
jgi:tRNA dimethylallyltransferase